MNMELDDEARIALKVIYTRGVVRGKDVKRLAGISDTSKLSEVLRTLENQKFITVQRGGGGETDEGTLEAFAAPLPSRRAQGEYEITKT
jgi:predicted transcriptional regulator